MRKRFVGSFVGKSAPPDKDQPCVINTLGLILSGLSGFYSRREARRIRVVQNELNDASSQR